MTPFFVADYLYNGLPFFASNYFHSRIFKQHCMTNFQAMYLSARLCGPGTITLRSGCTLRRRIAGE